MKTRYIVYTFMSFMAIWGCTPDSDMLVDFNDFEITKVELGADHRQLIADGVSTLTLNPMLYQSYTFKNEEGRDSVVFGKIPVDRIKEGTVNYFLEDGTPMNGPTYKTTGILYYCQRIEIRSF